MAWMNFEGVLAKEGIPERVQNLCGLVPGYDYARTRARTSRNGPGRDDFHVSVTVSAVATPTGFGG